jgi:uncharacterized protein YecT (DUF1311 family)
MRAWALILATFGTVAVAQADELDNWCAQAQKASSIVICSDPELRQQATARNQLFEVARTKLSPEAYSSLTKEQSQWVKAYTARCGVSLDGPTPPLPIPQNVIDCYRRESRIRTAALAAILTVPNPIASSASAAPAPPAPLRAAPAPAAKDTGYDLYLACGSQNTNPTEFFRCVTFVLGVWDGAMTMQSVAGEKKFCPRTGVQAGQMALIFEDWARKHPADLGHDAVMAVLASFIDAFPCSPSSQSSPDEPNIAPAIDVKPADPLVR